MPAVSQKARTNKSRLVRRRRPARGDIESDDEIERTVPTDSEFDSDESLSPDSATESEHSASEDDIPDRQIDAHTPNTSHSSGALEKDNIINDDSSRTLFSTTGDWSEMVTDPINGASELPVIEFSDFKVNATPDPRPSQKRTRKPNKKKNTDTFSPVLPASPSKSVNGNTTEEITPPEKDLSKPSIPQPKRLLGQSARQAYQQRLESDPSFVPKVGGFWGHDDRLMDKDLRSLSGWWRGKWQGRGRDRGGLVSGPVRRGSHIDENKEEEVNLPPIEQPWTHDGFEEMKRKEEQRSETQAQRQAGSSVRGSARGRGSTAAPRGSRGGRSGLPRSELVNPGRRASAMIKPDRVWYVMRPEHMWTKQSENFLYSQPKHRGSGPSYRVHLPGSQTQPISSLSSYHLSEAANHVSVATASVAGSDVGDRAVVVKLPVRHEEEELLNTADEASLDDVFKVRPRLVNTEPIPLPAPSSVKSSSITDRQSDCPQPSPSAGDPNPVIRSQLEQLSMSTPSTDPTRRAQTEKAVLRDPAAETPNDEVTKSPVSQAAHQRPPLPQIQPVYSPSSTHPSSTYPSPYYAALPPGVAFDQPGIPYEMATGRPVYIPIAAPPHNYNLRPNVHPHLRPSYVSPHMHNSSIMSPDFVQQSPSHSHASSASGFIDPATGVPIFSFPRASRIEIRAPDEATVKLNDNTKRTPAASFNDNDPSRLNMSSVSYAAPPSHPGVKYGYNPYSSPPDVNTFPSYVSPPEASVSAEASTNTIQPMIPYPTYQQYYYPEPIYGYPQYMDASQAGQYEAYPPMETHGTTYY